MEALAETLVDRHWHRTEASPRHSLLSNGVLIAELAPIG
jgi:hypothetical protein